MQFFTNRPDSRLHRHHRPRYLLSNRQKLRQQSSGSQFGRLRYWAGLLRPNFVLRMGYSAQFDPKTSIINRRSTIEQLIEDRVRVRHRSIHQRTQETNTTCTHRLHHQSTTTWDCTDIQLQLVVIYHLHGMRRRVYFDLRPSFRTVYAHPHRNQPTNTTLNYSHRPVHHSDQKYKKKYWAELQLDPPLGVIVRIGPQWCVAEEDFTENTDTGKF